MLATQHVVGMAYLVMAAPKLALTAFALRVQPRFADNIRLAIKALRVLQFRQRPVAAMLVEPPAGISGTRRRERACRELVWVRILGVDGGRGMQGLLPGRMRQR